MDLPGDAGESIKEWGDKEETGRSLGRTGLHVEALIIMVIPDDLKLSTGQSELGSGREPRIGINVPSYMCKDDLDTL